MKFISTVVVKNLEYKWLDLKLCKCYYKNVGTLNCQLFFSKTNDFLSHYLPCQAARSIHTIETYRDGPTVFRKYITNVRKIPIKKFLFTDCTSELMLDYLGYLNSQGCEAYCF